MNNGIPTTANFSATNHGASEVVNSNLQEDLQRAILKQTVKKNSPLTEKQAMELANKRRSEATNLADLPNASKANKENADNLIKAQADIVTQAAENLKTSTMQSENSGRTASESISRAPNLYDKTINKLKTSENKVFKGFAGWLDKMTRDSDALIPALESVYLSSYVAAPALNALAGKNENLKNGIKKLSENVPRFDQMTKTLQKGTKSFKNNDSLRLAGALFDITPAIFSKPENMYVTRNVAVGLSNIGETVQEKYEHELDDDGRFKNFLQGPKLLLKLVTSLVGDIAKNPAVLKDKDWLQNSGATGLINLGAAFTSRFAQVKGNDGLARTGRGVECLAVDADKFLSKNAERNNSAFGFGLEFIADMAVDKLGENPLTLSLRSVVGSAAKILGNKAQSTKRQENFTTLFDNPVAYMANAAKEITKAANPIAKAQEAARKFKNNRKVAQAKDFISDSLENLHSASNAQLGYMPT